MKHRRPLLLLASLALSAGVVGSALAAEPEDIIKYRQATMKAIGGHMAASAAIISGKVDYKADLADHAKALAALTKDIAALFPKGSDFGDTEALDAVWTKNDEFKKRAKDAKDRAGAFAKAMAAGDAANYGKRFMALNDACKACHKDFRKEEK
jgi:cytochrome c556